MAWEAGCAAPACPIRQPESSARITERRPEFNGDARRRSELISDEKAGNSRRLLGVRRGNVRAITPPHQHAILGLAHIGDAHGKPYSDRRQRDGKSEGGNVGQHAMTKIVRLFPVALVARPRAFLPSLLSRFFPLTRRAHRGPWPELEHAMLLLRRNWLLGIHCCQLRNPATTLARPQGVSQEMLAWHECGRLSRQCLVEPAVIDSKSAIFRSAEDFRVAVSKPNVGVIVGLTGVDGLRRNDI